MDKNTVKKLKELGYPVNLNGELISIQEIERRYFQGIKYRQEKWLNKACEYLKANIPIPENVGNWYVESFIQQFRKAMEE